MIRKLPPAGLGGIENQRRAPGRGRGHKKNTKTTQTQKHKTPIGRWRRHCPGDIPRTNSKKKPSATQSRERLCFETTRGFARTAPQHVSSSAATVVEQAQTPIWSQRRLSNVHTAKRPRQVQFMHTGPAATYELVSAKPLSCDVSCCCLCVCVCSAQAEERAICCTFTQAHKRSHTDHTSSGSESSFARFGRSKANIRRASGDSTAIFFSRCRPTTRSCLVGQLLEDRCSSFVAKTKAFAAHAMARPRGRPWPEACFADAVQRFVRTHRPCALFLHVTSMSRRPGYREIFAPGKCTTAAAQPMFPNDIASSGC